ncbi:MAG: universal stress protein [Candidatus Eremiobacteraeota bacterium]|nr:universal stress protein [Candidatus Eremiobacteraeota bacterium]
MAAAFAHITVPVDGSTTAARGIAFALEFARGGGSVTFCSVVDPTLACLPVGYGVAADPGPMLIVLDDDATLFCRAAQAKATGAGVASDTQVLHGQCVQAIESLVRQNGSQAIVVGTHGRTGLARSLLGSVAEGLLRRCDIPVVVVHEGDVTRMGPIAVAFDESPAAHAALGTAIAIGAARGIPIALIHISGAPTAVDSGRVDALMAGAAKRAAAQGVNAEVVVRNGRAPETLLAAADELDCSMIVMGTHGRPFVERLMLGSVAAYVVQHARIPVVTVRRATSS